MIVSTATVALHEQLFHQDLPRLAEIIPGLHFDLLKCRGRYVCDSRVDGALSDAAQDSLLGDEFTPAFADTRRPANTLPRDSAKAMHWFKQVAKKRRSGQWDGELDTLAQPPVPHTPRLPPMP